MSKHSTAQTGSESLLETLCGLLRKTATSYRQGRVFVNSAMLVIAVIATFGRHTMTQLLTTLGRETEDWSRFYRLFSRRRFDEEAHFRQIAEATIAETSAQDWYVVGVDATHIPRSNEKTATVGWFKALGCAVFRSGIMPGQRFSHCAALLPAGEGRSRAIPIRFLHAPQASAVKGEGEVAIPEYQAAVTVLQWVRGLLDGMGRAQQRMLVLADGSYDKVELWSALPKQTALLVRTARNRILYALHEEVKGKRKRGRPALYGERLPAPHAYIKERSKMQQTTVCVRQRMRPMRYRLVGPVVREGASHLPLFLLVIGGGSYTVGKKQPKKKRTEPVYYLVSAVRRNGAWQLPLPVEQLLAWLWQRWELEVAHREMKSDAKIGDMQCSNRNAIVLSVQWAVWVYALCLLVGWHTWGTNPGPKPPGKWRRNPYQRWTFKTVVRSLQVELAHHPDFSSLCRPPTTNWQKIEDWGAALLPLRATTPAKKAKL